MIRALYSAASGMSAQQMNVDNIAHNLANANTTGFKARRAQFQDLMYQTIVQPGSAAGAQTVVPTGLQVGLGTRTASGSGEQLNSRHFDFDHGFSGADEFDRLRERCAQNPHHLDI